MRQEKDKIIKTVFRTLELKTRERLDLTQKEMADRLDMCERSYFDIEAGKTKCLAVAESNTQGFEGQIFPYTSPNFS